jgi:HD-like signal output (HDOD) protein
VSRLGSLPSPPSLYFSLLDECRSEQGTQRRVADIVRQDPAMTASVLRLVNSAFFGRYGRISDPLQAVMLLGLNTIRALALSTHVFSQFMGGNRGYFSLDDLQRSSVATSGLARVIANAEHASHSMVEDASIGGLLRDAGLLVLGMRLPVSCQTAHGMARREGISLDHAERAVLGATHGAVGAYLLGLWALPAAVVEAVAYHHEPGRCVDQTFGPLTVVHVADALAIELGVAAPLERAAGIDTDYLERAGVAHRLEAWREACQRSIDASREAANG